MAIAAGILSTAPGCGSVRRPAPSPDYSGFSISELQARADGDARALRELAFRASQSGDGRAALEYLDRALRKEPDSSDAHNIRGMVYARAGETDYAARDFQRAAQLAPGKAGPLLNLGRLYLSLGRHLAAAGVLQRAADLAPANAEAAILAGDAWREGGSPVAAKKYYRRALELAPRDPRAHAGLGEVLNNSGHAAEAREHLEQAVALGDHSPRTRGYLGLARALAAASPADGAAAREHLAAARAAGETGAHLYYGMGLAYLAERDYPRAEKSVREGIDRHPDVAGLYHTLAEVYAVTGRPSESSRAREKSAALAAVRQAEERLQAAITGAPETVAPYLAYADWLISRGEHERAIPPLEQALQLDGRNARVQAALRQARDSLSRRRAPSGAASRPRETGR